MFAHNNSICCIVTISKLKYMLIFILILCKSKSVYESGIWNYL